MIKLLEKLQSKQTKSQGGFTLIELLIVVLIIGILAAIAIPVFNNQRDKARDSAAQSAARNALSAAKTAQADNEDGNYVQAAVETEVSAALGETAIDHTGTLPSDNPEVIQVDVGATAGDGATTDEGNFVELCSQSASGTAFCVDQDGPTW